VTGPALRVGMIVPRFAPYHGGVESYAAEAAAALAAKGAEVTVVTQIPRGAGLPARDRHDGYSIERHYLPLGEIYDVPSLAAARAARSPRFDVVWTHSYHTPLAWLAAEQAKAPIVFTPWYHGGGHTPMRDALHKVYRPAGRRLMAASRRIVVATEAEGELVLRDFPQQVDRDKITLGAVSVADPVGGRQPYPGESNVVLTVARQEPYKRTDLLIRAVVELRDRGVPARLVVVGQGAGLAAYQELANELGANDVVTFTGAVDEESLGRWWASASLYATASLHEAYGLCLAEALVAGLPVVASSIAAHRDVVLRAGPSALTRLCDVDAPDVEAASLYADAMAQLLPSTSIESRKERAAQCTLPTAADMAEHLFDTLDAARS
jgi:glycosyltransferase involved in cell wall biosynthesis